MLRRIRQAARGYNIVEMALALVVLGLLLGGSLVPLQARYQKEEMNKVTAQLDAARDAVFAYALRNQTAERQYTAPHDRVTYTIPVGRPFLPCPDITADGLEDRSTLAVTPPGGTVTVLAEGACAQQKGLLPWKTLGLQQLDPWGNHLTYRVDEAYSNRVLGFDETFRAGLFDVDAPLSVRALSRSLRYQPRAEDNRGAIICENFYDDRTNGDCPGQGRYAENVLAGIINLEPQPVRLGVRRIDEYSASSRNFGIVEGAVFVILSHGRNGRGAVNRNGVCRAAPDSYVFQLGGASATRINEVANAYYADGHPFRACATVPSAPRVSVPPLRENLFAASPVADPGQGSDDIVVWGGASELLGVMLRGGILPVDYAEFLPE